MKKVSIIKKESHIISILSLILGVTSFCIPCILILLNTVFINIIPFSFNLFLKFTDVSFLLGAIAIILGVVGYFRKYKDRQYLKGFVLGCCGILFTLILRFMAAMVSGRF